MRISALLFLCATPTVLVPQSPPAPPARLIDMHMHVWGAAPLRASVRDSLSAAFRDVHLEKAFVSGALPQVLSLVAADSTHLLGGIIFDERHRLPPPQELRALFRSKRLAGLGEIDAQFAGVRLDAAWLEPYWTLSEALDVFAAVHTGFAQPGTVYDSCCPAFRTTLGNPQLLEPVLARHAKLRVYLMHAGWPYLQETKAIMQMYPQVYADLAAFAFNPGIPREEFYDYLQALLRAGLGKRLMFGSGLAPDEWPGEIRTAIALVNEAPFLTAEQRADIFYNNAARFLRLAPGLP
jgi:predicted TIM-barrel fold metal-dependent hydrolase